jgi:hypothetical protein
MLRFDGIKMYEMVDGFVLLSSPRAFGMTDIRYYCVHGAAAVDNPLAGESIKGPRSNKGC